MTEATAFSCACASAHASSASSTALVRFGPRRERIDPDRLDQSRIGDVLGECIASALELAHRFFDVAAVRERFRERTFLTEGGKQLLLDVAVDDVVSRGRTTRADPVGMAAPTVVVGRVQLPVSVAVPADEHALATTPADNHAPEHADG
jgi:hypothetical protein